MIFLLPISRYLSTDSDAKRVAGIRVGVWMDNAVYM